MRPNRQRRHQYHDPTPAAPAAAPALRLLPPDPALAAERRMRDAGGPQDTALYRCACGYAFEAAVTTTVKCPHCSSGVAW